MGAMENKGLNIFNSHYVLADEEHATDRDFMGIESVIAHEYFHNWTGNRITCRDWFQLTLKEGLTVFRDQCFSADMNSPVVQRINDVKMLQQRQFAEDAGPTAHPIKPDHYIEINNFYTATVYEKGAEVIRMLHTFLGPEKFREGMDRYFELFDGQAVTTEDFIFALTQKCKIDVEQFKLWYTQECTPVLLVDEEYDAKNHEYTLHLKQMIPRSLEGKEQKPYIYPLKFALLDENGKELDFLLEERSQIKHQEGMLIVSKEHESLLFKNISTHPKLSINRDFSAPVKVVFEKADYSFLMSHDSDGFNRYEAAQTLALQNMIGMAEGKKEDSRFVEAFGEVLTDRRIDLMSKALILELPGVDMLMQEQKPAEIESLVSTHEKLMRTLAARYEDTMLEMYGQLSSIKRSCIDADSMAHRAMKNCLLGYLAELENACGEELCVRQYYEAAAMTEKVFALKMLEDHYAGAAKEALDDFYRKYESHTLVMNKYLSIIASSRRDGVLERVKELQNDAVFDVKVPNLVRSLIGSFAKNLKHFHDKSAEGYVFIADKIIELDTINPQMASSIAGAFKSYDRLGIYNRKLIKKELERILESDGISKNVYEIVEKILTA
jgi:aminopeptidase N